MFAPRYFSGRHFPGRYFVPTPDFVVPNTWATINSPGDEADEPTFEDIAPPSDTWTTITPPSDGWTEQ